MSHHLMEADCWFGLRLMVVVHIRVGYCIISDLSCRGSAVCCDIIRESMKHENAAHHGCSCLAMVGGFFFFFFF